MPNDVFEHSKATWNHVLHRDATVAEYAEAGIELVGVVALATIAKGAAAKFLDEALSDSECFGSFSRVAPRTESRVESELLIPELARRTATSTEGFRCLTPAECETLSVSSLAKIAESNQRDLEVRVAALGANFPRIAFHSCDSANAIALESSLSGASAPVKRYLALPVAQAPSAEEKLADTAGTLRHSLMGGYHYGDQSGKLFAFDLSAEDVGSSVYSKNPKRPLPLPFQDAQHAGEVVWPLGKTSRPIAVIAHSELVPHQPSTDLPDYFERLKHLEPIHYQVQIDKILKAIERKVGNY